MSDTHIEDMRDIGITLMTLRKPTELKKVIDAVPKPVRAVPKNGLPFWYKMGLESKLPVPKMPEGKIVFSRGKIGEDVRRLGLGAGGPAPSFDLTDPYCNNVSYDYVPMHDPHLAHYFTQKPARNRMKLLGFVTKDGRAICNLKEFNQYRKYLYNQYQDRIHAEMRNMDERAKDDLTLIRVERDVARRQLIFKRSEKAREHFERINKEHADEFAEKKRLAKEQEKKIQARMLYLAEYNETQRRERASKAREKQDRIKQRVQAAAELELRRKISMIRQWRANEKKRLARLKFERESKKRRKEEEANNKWSARVSAQNSKIQQEAMLLKLYTEDMAASAHRRIKKSQAYAYNTDLELQRIRLENWKQMHGGNVKAVQLIKKMGMEFEKSKRGAKGMSMEYAMQLAVEAMASALSTPGDTLMSLGRARAKMDVVTVLPSAPVNLLEEALETAVVEFARRRVHLLMRNVERLVRQRASIVFFQNIRRTEVKKKKMEPRWAAHLKAEFSKHFGGGRSNSIAFGAVTNIVNEETTELDMKSVRGRVPTPVPSRTQLAEVTFCERLEDLPDPVTNASHMPEREKLLEMLSIAAKLLVKSVTRRVEVGMDAIVGQVTLPNMRHPMDWGEAVEGLAIAVVNNAINQDSADVRRTSEFLAHRIMKAMRLEMVEEKLKKKQKKEPSREVSPAKDFYVPGQVEKTTSQTTAQATPVKPN